MSDSALTAIQQHMYTRERRGIFRTTEGYDSIAKSAGLDNQFIKKQLHPFCGYDAPAELAARGERDASAYPWTMHRLRLDNGDILLGRSVYQAADFTGLRSAFFTHNYVIPADHPDQSERRDPDWLRASFADSYDIGRGAELPELADLPMEQEGPAARNYRALLAELGFGERRFKQLLFAVMAAIGGKKKVYVALDAPVSELPDKAVLLLESLYGSLPYPFRRQLGFITYAKEPQSRKSVHLAFVERGSLRMGDRSIEKEFTFDMANDRVMNADTEGTDQPYLDLAWDNLDRRERADRFFQFAEAMLAGMDPERQLSAASYRELTVLFRIEEGDEALYEADKGAVLRSLFEYMRPAGTPPDAKIRLSDLFLSRFDYEFDRVRQGQVPETFVAESFKEYYRIGDKNMQAKIVTYFVLALNHALTQGRPDMAASFYAAMESNPALSGAFFTKVLADRRLSPLLLEPYIEEKLRQGSTAADVVRLIGKWGGSYPALLGSLPFQELACELLADRLRRESNKVAAASEVYDQLDKLERDFQAEDRASGYGSSDLLAALAKTAGTTLIGVLDPDKLPKEQLLQAAFLDREDRAQLWDGELDDRELRSKAAVLEAAYEWFTRDAPGTGLFAGLSAAEIESVQRMGRRYLPDECRHGRFGRVVPAFYSGAELEKLDYAGLIDCLRTNATKETLYRFFKWSETQPDFMRPRGFVPAYISAVSAYFKRYDRDAFKKRAEWKRNFGDAGPAMQAVYRKLQQEMSSPAAKFFRRNRKAAVMIGMLAVAAVLVAGGLLLSDNGGDKPGNAEAQQPEQTPGDSGAGQTPPAADIVVYAEQPDAAEQEQATSLVFLFKDASVCAGFKPDSLAIVTPDSKTTEYSGFSYTTACPTDLSQKPASGSGSEGVQDADKGSSPDGSDESADSAQFSGKTDNADGTGKEISAGEGSDSSSWEGDSANGGGSGSEAESGNGNAGTGSGSGNAGSAIGSGNGNVGTGSGSGNGGSATGSDNGNVGTGSGTGNSGSAIGSGNGNVGMGSGSGNGGSATGSESGNAGTGEQSGGGTAIQDDYPGRVTIQLGKRIDIPLDSIIRIGQEDYKLSQKQ